MIFLPLTFPSGHILAWVNAIYMSVSISTCVLTNYVPTPLKVSKASGETLPLPSCHDPPGIFYANDLMSILAKDLHRGTNLTQACRQSAKAKMLAQRAGNKEVRDAGTPPCPRLAASASLPCQRDRCSPVASPVQDE